MGNGMDGSSFGGICITQIPSPYEGAKHVFWSLPLCFPCLSLSKVSQMYSPEMSGMMSLNEHLMRYNCSFNLLTRNDGFAEPSLTSFAVSCCFSTTFLRRNLGWGTHLLDPLIGGPASTDFSHGAVTAEGEIRMHTLSSFPAPWMKSLTSWNFDRMVFEASFVQGFVLILPKSCLFQSSFWAIFGDVGTTFNSPLFW